MEMNLDQWINAYLQAVTSLFGERLLFVGLQGSFGRGEANDQSDIDMVLILDTMTAHDLKAYDAAISKLPQREKICGFIAGKQELFCWSKADLFQFYHDTTPLLGDLRALIPEITDDDVRCSILMGACNIYHLCGHNIVHEKEPGILKSLFKGAVFVAQALHYHRTGIYIKKHHELSEMAAPRERQILSEYFKIRDVDADQDLDFNALSETLFVWAGEVIQEFGRESTKNKKL